MIRKFVIIKEEVKIIIICMIIFYGGRVVVFDDLLEDKVYEIMILVSLRVINFCF